MVAALMTTLDLHDALEPVRDHFHGDEINANTVLAAHLRAAGAQPNGESWTTAKAELQEGSSFAEAAAVAAEAESVADGGPALASRSEPNGGRRARRPEAETAESLTWFPKRFGPGDLDGRGARRLLGQPHAPPVAVLVRETAQNSWDARLPDQTIRFELHLRRVTSDEAEFLRARVLTGDATKLRLRELLGGGDLWALEINDRGTTGLGGPVRNDIAIPTDVSTDFIDFVLNVGAPRDKHLGGGTYGFGKTISYVVSSVGTQLIWSRSNEGGTIEDRLMGSAIGDSFDDEEDWRFTGRHWWGRLEDGERPRVEPLTGEPARDLAAQIFRTGFEEGGTGTSLLILDPRLGGDTRRQDAERLANCVLWHLWPKLVPGSDQSRRMDIRVMYEGEEIPLPRIDDHPVLCGYAQALRAVRAVQGERAHEAALPTEVREVWCHSPKKLLGHIAFTTYQTPFRGDAAGSDDVIPIRGWSHHVALMRHQAELLVRYESGPAHNVDGIQWAGVFKPIEEVDDSYAESEPPAHDDWVPQFVEDRARRSEVNVGLTRISEAITKFTRPRERTDDDSQSVVSAAALGDALADLVAPLEGSRPTTEATRGRRGSPGTPSPTVDIQESHLGPVREDGRRFAAIRFQVSHPDRARVRVRPTLAVAYEGGSEGASEWGSILGWSTSEPSLEKPDIKPLQDLQIDSGTGAWLVLEVTADLAFDIRLRAEDV